MNVLHRVGVVGTQSRGEYLGHRRNPLASHLESQLEAFVKSSGYRQNSKYELR